MLPVLWRSDEEGAEPDARMELQPGTSIDETILCMIHLRFTTPMRGSIFQFPGQCMGELFSECGIDRHLPALCAIQPESKTGNQFEYMPITANFDNPSEDHRQQHLKLLDKLQTQNA